VSILAAKVHTHKHRCSVPWGGGQVFEISQPSVPNNGGLYGGLKLSNVITY